MHLSLFSACGIDSPKAAILQSLVSVFKYLWLISPAARTECVGRHADPVLMELTVWGGEVTSLRLP